MAIGTSKLQTLLVISDFCTPQYVGIGKQCVFKAKYRPMVHLNLIRAQVCLIELANSAQNLSTEAILK